jgi:DNA polymerase-3 subunit beta
VKLTIARVDALKLLDRVRGSADDKAALPILKTILLRAETPPVLGQGKLHACATDLYRASFGAVDADVAEAGAVALPARGIVDRVKAMPDGLITISVDAGLTATIKAVKGQRSYSLSGSPASEFPKMPEAGAHAREIPIAVLAKALARVSYAISDDATRPHLNSTLIVCDNDGLSGAATDGHRMAFQRVGIAASTSGAAPEEWMVSQVSASELIRLLGESKGEGNCSVSKSDAWLIFGLAGVTYGAKLVSAQFPPYRQVIDLGLTHAAKVSRTDLASAVKAVSLASGEKTGGIKLTLRAGSVLVEAESSEAGKGSDSVDAEYDGPEVMVAFNARYLLDTLVAYSGAEVELWTKGDPMDPIRVTPVGETDEGLCMVMPMRL